MQEEKRKEAEPMASEVIRVAQKEEAYEILHMLDDFIEQNASPVQKLVLKAFRELLIARIRAK